MSPEGAYWTGIIAGLALGSVSTIVVLFLVGKDQANKMKREAQERRDQWGQN